MGERGEEGGSELFFLMVFDLVGISSQLFQTSLTVMATI